MPCFFLGCVCLVPPTPLEADVPCSGLRKGGLLHKHSRQHATKTQCWSSCKDPPISTPTYLPTCITCIYINYIYCIYHLPTPPTSYSTAHATTRPPPLLLTPGVHHTPRWPRPRRPAPAPPCPAVKEPDNGPRDPDRRPLRLPQTPKSSLTRSAFGLRRPVPLPSLVYLARSVPSSFTRSMRFDTAFITTAFLLTALTTTVSAFPVFAPQGTHHAPKAAAPPPLACPPARTCPPTSALANHSSLVLLPRPAATMQHASKTVDCMA